jgi:hypothetical protein
MKGVLFVLIIPNPDLYPDARSLKPLAIPLINQLTNQPVTAA